jgi:hypothetical protein
MASLAGKLTARGSRPAQRDVVPGGEGIHELADGGTTDSLHAEGMIML